MAYNQHNNNFYHNKVLAIRAIAKHRDILCICIISEEKKKRILKNPMKCMFILSSTSASSSMDQLIFTVFFTKALSELNQTFRMHVHSDMHIHMHTQECKYTLL